MLGLRTLSSTLEVDGAEKLSSEEGGGQQTLVE